MGNIFIFVSIKHEYITIVSRTYIFRSNVPCIATLIVVSNSSKNIPAIVVINPIAYPKKKLNESVYYKLEPVKVLFLK